MAPQITPRDVESTVKAALACDGGALILPATRIVDLGADQLDISDICHRLGINYTKYCAAGSLTEAYSQDMRKIEASLVPTSIRQKHFSELADLRTTKDLLDHLLVDDFRYIGNFQRMAA
jgi:hypothetical protein